MVMMYPRTLLGLLLCCTVSAQAAIQIQGVQDEGIYADQVSFTVSSQADATTTATLNGQAIAIDQEIDVTVPEYYELFVQQQPLAGGDLETQRVRFIVRASERGSTENGLPLWTPYVNIPSAPAEFIDGQLTCLLPQTYPTGLELPLAVRITDDQGRRMPVNGTVEVNGLDESEVTLFRGVGSVFLPADTHTVSLEVAGLIATHEVTLEEDTQWQTLSSDIVSNIDFGEQARIYIRNVTDDQLTIAAGATMVVGAGSVILIDPDITLNLEGTLLVQGTAEAPVVITAPDRSQPWGGFLLETAGASIVMDYTIITASGADTAWFDDHPNSGHSHQSEQGLFYISNEAQVTLNHCALLQNSGQIGHGESGYFTLNHCLVQQAITMGQYNRGAVIGYDTAFIEFPKAGDPFIDDDNDAIYLSGGAHAFTDCLFGWTLDDGIDAGEGAEGSVLVDNCWFESCIHEAMAWSSGPRHATVRDSVVLNCGQAIECGYGTPYIDAANCLVTGNVVGARFGDNYDRSYTGTLDVVDSLLLYNHRDIWTVDWTTWEPRLAQCDLHDNWVTQANANYPDNELWSVQDSNTQAALIAPFEPNVSLVGIGFAVEKDVQDMTLLLEPIVVRLSRFSSQTVDVNYCLTLDDEILASGNLTFPPGQTVQKIEGLPAPVSMMQLTLSDPIQVELTGITQITYVDAADLIQPLVDQNSLWQYAKGMSEPAADWSELGFDDTSWLIGLMPMGYEASSGYQDCLATVVSDMRNQYYSLYARHSFTLDDPAQLAELYLTVNFDDGYIVYLNGFPVDERNAPNPVAFDQYASGSHEACCGSCDLAAIDLTEFMPLLQTGDNVIAIQGHNRTLDSSDFMLDVALWGVKRL